MTGFRSVIYAVAAATALAIAPHSKADVIYQAFDESFETVRAKVPKLKELGYTYVQVSPPAKSLNRSDWWARYQPLDLRLIEGPLGNEAQLAHLISEAHDYGLKVLIDAVLNHMGDDQTKQDRLVYAEFGPQDFHFPDQRPCIDNYRDRYQVTQFWLCDPQKVNGLPDLNTSSPYVREVHKKFLEKLMALGADGFRYDAMKHVEASYWHYISKITKDKYVYGEVIGETLEESNEYTPIMPVTDFHLLRTLLGAFSLGGDMRSLYNPEENGQALPADKAIVFSRNHDTAMHRDFFNFGDYQDAMLANAYILARGRGTPFIYRDDWEQRTVKAGVQFHNAMKGKPDRIRRTSEICESESTCSPRTTLFIERGSEGFAIINTANAPLHTASAKMPGLAPGCYQELVYNFSMFVDVRSDGQKWVSRWSSNDRQGIHIGPRTALMFVKKDNKDCLVQE